MDPFVFLLIGLAVGAAFGFFLAAHRGRGDLHFEPVKLGEIGCRTTVLVGSLDRAFLPTSERLVEGIRGARLEVIDGAYHSPQHTHPEQWLGRVRAHLAWADESA